MEYLQRHVQRYQITGESQGRAVNGDNGVARDKKRWINQHWSHQEEGKPHAEENRFTSPSLQNRLYSSWNPLLIRQRS